MKNVKTAYHYNLRGNKYMQEHKEPAHDKLDRLQERHYGLSLSEEATAWLDEAADDKRMFADRRKVGSGARLVRFWKGERYEAVVRDDGRYEYDGEIYSSLSAVAKAITGMHWNGCLFFGVK